MYTFKIDDTGDITFDGQNSIVLVEDKDEQAQAVKTRMSTNKGEWFLNTLYGLAYKYLQVKNPDLSRIRAEILRTFQQETRITKVDSLVLNFNNSTRKLTISFELAMDDGNTVKVGNEVITV